MCILADVVQIMSGNCVFGFVVCFFLFHAYHLIDSICRVWLFKRIPVPLESGDFFLLRFLLSSVLRGKIFVSHRKIISRGRVYIPVPLC